jgi:TonB family protein
MNDAVADVIAEREALDHGFSGGILVSFVAHGVLLGGAFLAAWLAARAPSLRVPDGMVVPLPPGGGGPTEVAAGVPAPVKSQPPEPQPEPPAPEPPKVVKPPKEEPPKKALPDPEVKKTTKKETPPPTRRAAAASTAPPRPGPVGATGTRTSTSATPGLGIIGPEGPGVPGGTDPNGDWYLAGVQRKIWIIWNQQLKPGFVRPVRLSLTINADGSLADGSVRILEPSGTAVIDMAARRAVFSAAPFSPLPRHYATDRITIQALFQPLP